MLLLIAVCTFGTVFLLVIGITMKSEGEIAHERMERQTRFTATSGSSMEFDFSLDSAFRDRVLLPVIRRLAQLGMRFTPAGSLQLIDEKLETAGHPWSMGSKEFIGLRVLSAIFFVLVAILVGRFVAVEPLLRIVLMALIVFIGVILPDYTLQQTINNRQSKIRKALADTLDLLTVSVEAGLGLDGAMRRVVDKLEGPLSDEMDRALREMQVGKPRAEALKDMSKRVKLQELSSFVAAIVQADQLGVSIANVLRVQSATLREQRSQRARETAAKLPVKMLFPLVLFIFPAIFIVILGPAAINIYRLFISR